MYQQQNNLIADPTNQQWPVVNVQNGSPHIRVGIDVPGELAPYFPFIVTGLISEIQNKMTFSAQRMHLFNLTANNGYANTEFFSMVELCTMWIDAACRTTQNMTPEHAIQTMIPQFVGVYALALVETYPTLYQFLDANAQNSVNQAIQTMQQIVAQVDAVQRQMGRGAPGVQSSFHNGNMTGRVNTYGSGQQGNYHGGYQNANRVMPNRPTNNFAAATTGGPTNAVNGLFSDGRTPVINRPEVSGPVTGQTRFERMAIEREKRRNNAAQTPAVTEDAQIVNTAPGAWRNNMANRTLLKTAQTEPVAQAPAEQTNQQVMYNRRVMPNKMYDHMVVSKQETVTATEEAKSTQPPVSTNTAVSSTKETVVVVDAPKRSDWKPSVEQPYKTLYDFTKYKQTLVKAGEHTLFINKLLTAEEIATMNPEDHAMIKPPVQRYDANREIDKADSEEITDTKFPALPEFDITFSPHHYMDLSAGKLSAITGLRYRVSTSNRDANNRAVVKVYPAIIIDVVSIDDAEHSARYREVIDKFSACQSFQEALQLLDDISDDERDRMFFNRLNMLITDEINNVLQMNFSSKMSIDSFFDDWNDILRVLIGMHSKALIDNFLSNQRLFFQQTFSDLEKDLMIDQAESLYTEFMGNREDNPDDYKGEFVMVPWMTSYAHMHLPSYQLNISLQAGETGSLTPQTTPELYALAIKLLDCDGDQRTYRRHYLTTNDGLQFIIQRGYLNPDAILIRRLHGLS